MPVTPLDTSEIARMNPNQPRVVLFALFVTALSTTATTAQVTYPLPYPPKLPDGKKFVTDSSPEFLKPGPNLREGVEIARTPPVVDFLYYPNQTYAGNPWCFRGVGTVSGDKFYSALCDHKAPLGTSYLFEYDSTKKTFRLLVNTARFLRSVGQITPQMNYSPGEIQTRIDFGSDGWLYYGTTRGSTTASSDRNGFKGEWVIRTDPVSGKSEVVSAYPVSRHCILASVFDPERMIFYGGTASGDYSLKKVFFFALDVKSGKVIKTADGGFDRYSVFARSTGKVYWEGKTYDPDTNEITTSMLPHVRSATSETPQGMVYGTSHRSADIWGFNVRSETVTQIGPGAVGTQGYVSAMHADPSGRYLYYIPGAHGGASKDGTPVVQYDLKHRKRKVLAFLHAYYLKKLKYNLEGSFCSVLGPKGEKLYISWDGWREGHSRRSAESSALTVIYIPASERS